MKNIIPVTDLQRQAGQIVNGFNQASAEPVIITQRGRAAAILLPVRRYEEIEADLARLDELELQSMLAVAETQIAARQTVSHQQVKARIAERMKSAKKKASPTRLKPAK
jgi:prevent-host-death family protein